MKGGVVGVAHLYGTSEMKKNEKARNGVHGFLHFPLSFFNWIFSFGFFFV